MADDATPLYGFQSTLLKHPLDPLSPREIKTATLAVLEHVRARGGSSAADEVRFIEVALKEADKVRVILAARKKDSPPPDRHALVIMFEKVGGSPLILLFEDICSCSWGLVAPNAPQAGARARCEIRILS